MMINQGWIAWLNGHKSRARYDSNPEKVTKLCDGSGTAKEKFVTISQSKNIVLLTKAPIGKKCQVSFLHSVVGCPINPEELRYVARSGMKTGTGIEIDPDSMFGTTSAKLVPTVTELMKVSSVKEADDLKAPRTGTRVKSNSFAVLTPSLAEGCQQGDMTPAALLVKVVETIKAGSGPAEIGGVTSDETASVEGGEPQMNEGENATNQTEDDLLEKMGKPFEGTLRFLWALHHRASDFKAPITAAIEDEESLEWLRETGAWAEPPKPAVTVDLTDQTPAVSDGGTLTAMTKLSETMVKYQETAARIQEEKTDVRLKSWNRIPQIQKDIILLGGITENSEVPTEPTEEMLSILGCQNGAQVEQYLRQVMIRHSIQLEPGLCSALNKGIIVHPNDASAPKHFSVFLTPPIILGGEKAENSNLLKLAVQSKYSEEDVVLLTKMDISVPMKAQDLRQQVRNIAGLAGRVFGRDSMLYHSLKEVEEHIDYHDVEYSYEFLQDRLFGGSILDRIHWRMHRFFDSCAYGDKTKIDVERLNFSDILKQVEKREYTFKAPMWLSNLVKSRERKPQTTGGGGKRRFFEQEDTKRQKIWNSNQGEEYKLREGEEYRFIFHPGNIKNIPKPKKRNGEGICLRYHCAGFCFRDCRFAGGHGNLEKEETSELVKYMDECRGARKKFLTNGRKPFVKNNEGRAEKNAERGKEVTIKG